MPLSAPLALALLLPANAALARQPDPIPPPAPQVSDAVALSRIPAELMSSEGLQLVLDRRLRQLMVLRDGRLLRRYPAAVGTEGWETPAGRHQVLEKVAHPHWEHPGDGRTVPPGHTNPLGSRWIGFHRSCEPRTNAWDGERYLSVDGCTVAGFHGTPHRWTVGRAVSHGCVRLYEESVQEVFDLVQVGTPVTVLP
ncbi:MAG: L,D-transpeptidase [Synechococcaceae bacterium WBB_3_034]|jgi:lipoprotein-anchoring transpeptidase ErfK/SrfK|nr:L,D-transpeptidase [Synechococcaceae bacterium WBB_3_034]NDG23884.1 L,D-transpeptidase [Synechococcaceae bacterium WBB_10_009]